MDLGLTCFTPSYLPWGLPISDLCSCQAWLNPTSLLVLDLWPGPFRRRTLLPFSPLSTPTFQIWDRAGQTPHPNPDHPGAAVSVLSLFQCGAGERKMGPEWRKGPGEVAGSWQSPAGHPHSHLLDRSVLPAKNALASLQARPGSEAELFCLCLPGPAAPLAGRSAGLAAWNTLVLFYVGLAGPTEAAQGGTCLAAKNPDPRLSGIRTVSGLGWNFCKPPLTEAPSLPSVLPEGVFLLLRLNGPLLSCSTARAPRMEEAHRSPTHSPSKESWTFRSRSGLNIPSTLGSPPGFLGAPGPPIPRVLSVPSISAQPFIPLLPWGENST